MAGAVGECTGKSMRDQCQLRGDSCVTPRGNVRATHRRFFAPEASFPFNGLRLAF